MKPLNNRRRTDAVPNVVKRQKILRQPVVHRTKVMRIVMPEPWTALPRLLARWLKTAPVRQVRESRPHPKVAASLRTAPGISTPPQL